ncbi:MAG TPA: PIN domain-containing protein [Phycisphaerales bacterium]|nr:PIN domain-containing protein [Phycisphaerales bacterium]
MAELIIFDTSVLVDLRRGLGAASAFTSPLASSARAAIHPGVSFELYDGVKSPADILLTQRMITTLRRLAVRDADFTVALSLFTTHQRRAGIGWADCLIAATALRLRLPVATLNDRHFATVPRLKVIRPY